jgi:hypothetical protein
MQINRNSFEAKCAWMRARQAKSRTRHPELYFEPVVFPAAAEGICRRCGRGYLPPLRSTPTRKFCDECRRARQSHYGRGRACATLTALDAAYIAGFFDGEGCASIHRRTTPGAVLEWTVLIINTKFAVIEWILRATVIGSVSLTKGVGASNDSKTWHAQSAGAVSFVDQLLPFLRVKREVAELFLESFGEALADPVVRRNRKWQDAILRKCRSLNRRGRIAPESAPS